MTAKEKIIGAVQTFAHETITEMVSKKINVPFLREIAVKQANVVADNVISKVEDKLDSVLFYITDKDGNINVGDFDDETMEKAFNEMPITEYSFEKVTCLVGEGCIDIQVPKNIFTTMLLGEERIISFTYSDIAKLKELINK